jgi:hypothetical protein
MHVLILQARNGGIELHKTGYHVLINYENIINNTRNVDILSGAGAGAESSLCKQAGGLSLC